ncbi:hypothetical protein H7F50_15225 [Novosphingobium flavum]|uniref:PAS domain-containing protein n=1 Tax=Novosphingobium aerophilum TaxID=2839843 RepID=A0A7X1F9R4_9SPHN|nr:hypothetical protein [Novosphingobium aerophilum]MBC2652993.1 hypothetical protein [Novosphingobium aerophilum]MBC2663103.1 hypothetical protein [Novosphingobium aerophilum]
METLRGPWGGMSDADYPETDLYDPAEDEIGHDTLPPVIGQDDRRMQVRAYNHWASLLGDRHFPLIADLETGNMPDFDPHSVLIDVSGGIEDPVIRYLGSALADESGCDPQAIGRLSEVPGRSLASRITDHYLQIIANEAPIGFEAEFVNQRGRTILYRGILLPFSASLAEDRVELIYGVINWKELADQQTTEELMLAIDQALRTDPRTGPLAERGVGGAATMAWADGPAESLASVDEPLELTVLADPGLDGEGLDGEGLDGAGLYDGGSVGDDPVGLADLLALARDLARAAQGSEDRSRHALYAAIGRAHDFALAAQGSPDEFAELVADAGLTMQARAPLLPVVKLVFGPTYDKTRLTEYASVIAWAQRTGVAVGQLTATLAAAPGGLKGVLKAEREFRRSQSGKPSRAESPRETLARKLRVVPTRPLAALPFEGEEFSLVLVRRTETGVVLLGEVPDDTALIERAARQLFG